ncbi:MAG: SAM-dependent methyltransferase [Roseburia sp.]|nr:SAM-dependent methyltransferase [Roseburia sp.]
MDEELRTLLAGTIDRGLYQIILSNARKKDELSKIKIRPVMLKGELRFQETAYRGTQVFHENYREVETMRRIENYMLQDFKQCEIEHTNIKATILVSKKGKMTIKKKNPDQTSGPDDEKRPVSMEHNRVKQYVLKEGIPVPFLIDLGVQSKDGKIVRARYDKYKQINRFLEFIEDILPALPADREIKIIDFGCGKSYLTFAIYYYLHELKGLDVSITGLDLKTDVIEKCNVLRTKYGYDKLHFIKGDIADYDDVTETDMVVTLHACDTATDYALAKAVKWRAGVILSVPCCQHEVNRQIECENLQPVLRYGIIKERMSALITDALRADLLRAEGYETDLLEFIDMEHTPKNILIRAVKNEGISEKRKREEAVQVSETADFLHVETTLQKLLR